MQGFPSFVLPKCFGTGPVQSMSNLWTFLRQEYVERGNQMVKAELQS